MPNNIKLNPFTGTFDYTVPGGNDTYLQYNDDGVLSGDSNLIWNKVSTTIGLNGIISFTEVSTPTTPSSGFGLLYVKDDGSGSSALFFLSDDGIETQLGAGGGGGATELPALTDVDNALLYTSGFVLQADGLQYTGAILAHSALSGVGTTTHPDIDIHIDSATTVHTAATNIVFMTGNQTIADVKNFTSLPTSSVVPTTGSQLVNKTYVDTFALGLTPKESCRVATTTAQVLASEFENGDTIDGVVLATGNRILIKDQADATTNGIYTVEASGAPTRATDSDTSAEVQEGTFTFISAGTVNASKQFVQITLDPTLGASNLVYTQLAGSTPYTASLGVELVVNDFRADLLSTGAIGLTGNELKVNVDASSIEISANALQVKALGITNAMLAGSIADSKLSTISTAGKVSGAALTSLSSIPDAAGVVPTDNLGSGTPDTTTFLRGDSSWAVPAGSGAGVVALAYTKMQDTNTTETTISNSAAEGTLYSYNVPANTLSTNKMLRITAVGRYLNNSGSNKTLALRLYYGGTAAANQFFSRTSGTIGTNANNGRWSITGYLAAGGATNVQLGFGGPAYIENGAGTFVAFATSLNDMGTLAIDSTAIQTLYVRSQHSAANANTSITTEFITIELVNASDNIGAPTDASYVTLAANGNLSNERVLTGTANQITITDNGAGSTVVLSTPQNIHTTATPTFTSLTVDDEVYGAGWNGALTVPTKNAVYDKIEAVVAGAGANTALSNLASVAINTSLISDTDITDDIGSLAIRWKTGYYSVLSTGDTATDTLLLQAYDSDGAAGTTFMTLTAGNTPTATISNVTSTTSFSPTTTDVGALGSTSLMWSDLFLASGGVINFNNGNSTITHSSDLLTFSDSVTITTALDVGTTINAGTDNAFSFNGTNALTLGVNDDAHTASNLSLYPGPAFGSFLYHYLAGTADAVEDYYVMSTWATDYFQIGPASDPDAFTIGANSSVGIGGIDPVSPLHIFANTTQTTIPQIYIEQDGTGDASLEFGIVGDSYIFGIDNSAADIFTIAYSGTQGSGVLGTGNLATLDASGQMNLYTVNNGTGFTINIAATQANVTAADIFMDFRSTTGSEATIAGTAVAGVIAYNTFTGSHYTIIEDKTNLEVGMVLEVINEKITEFPKLEEEEIKDENGEMVKTGEMISRASPKNHLMKARVCQTKGSKAALGVYGGTNPDGQDLVLSIGTGVILVKNTGDIEIGDYLISSDTFGLAELQGDDSYTNKTLAKAMENVIWAGEKQKLINCIYLGG